VIGGGYNTETETTFASMQRFTPGSEVWSSIPSLTIPRCAGTLTYVNHGILAAGGSSQGIEIGMSEFLPFPDPSSPIRARAPFDK
jgi:hypothetical protein